MKEKHAIAIGKSPTTHCRLGGITADSLDIKGYFRLKVNMGAQTFFRTFYVIAYGPAIPVHGIMGQDVLSAQGINILTTEGVLQFRGCEIPIKDWQPTDAHNGTGAPETCVYAALEPISVRLTYRCTVTSLSEVICWAKLSRPVTVGELGVIDVDTIAVRGFIGASTLVKVDDTQRVPVRLANFCQEEITLPQNKNVATFWTAVEDTKSSQVPAVADCVETLGDDDIAPFLISLPFLNTSL